MCVCLEEKGKNISRILHRLKEYNNKQVLSIEELESIGVLTPTSMNELHVYQEVIVAGIYLTIKKSSTFQNFYESKLIDHPLHINNEFPHELLIMIPENLVEKLTGGYYHCISGNFISYYNFIENNLDDPKDFAHNTLKNTYVINVNGVD